MTQLDKSQELHGRISMGKTFQPGNRKGPDQQDGIRVLLVDDDRDFVELTADYLEREQNELEIVTETDPTEAIQRIERDTFDCVLSDYKMSPLDGLELLREVRERSQIPFLLLTGQGSEEIASEAISIGVTDYLQKGFGLDRYTILANRVVNVVEQHRSQNELRESQKRLALFFEQSPLGVIEWDEEFNLIRLNETARQILGYSEEDLAGKSWEMLVPDSEHGSAEQSVDQLLGNEGGYHQISENVTKDGERIVCEWHNHVVTDDDGEVVSILSQFQDVTERERREETIANLHEVASELANSDTFETIHEKTINAAESLLSFDAAGLATLTEGDFEVLDCSEEGVRTELSAAIDAGIVQGAYENGETHVVEDIESLEVSAEELPSGTIMYVPIENHGVLQVSHSRAVSFDDTDRELTELLVQHAANALNQLKHEQEMREKTTQLEQQNEKLDEFVSVVSHDLRNPVQSLQTSLELAEQTGNNEDFERCKRSVDRIEGLLEDLLALARNDGEIEPTTLSLEELKTHATQNVDVNEDAVRVDESCLIEADRSRCLQLFENLIDNAVEHGGDDVTVRIGALDGGFYIEDDGSGIPESERENVFDHGYSGSSGGTGFGLAIVKRVVEDHDWEISITESDDGGARFEVTEVDSTW